MIVTDHEIGKGENREKQKENPENSKILKRRVVEFPPLKCGARFFASEKFGSLPAVILNITIGQSEENTITSSNSDGS